eukprot:1420051-Lingulodinium_polyedra.AAC.1
MVYVMALIKRKAKISIRPGLHQWLKTPFHQRVKNTRCLHSSLSTPSAERKDIAVTDTIHLQIGLQ